MVVRAPPSIHCAHQSLRLALRLLLRAKASGDVERRIRNRLVAGNGYEWMYGSRIWRRGPYEYVSRQSVALVGAEDQAHWRVIVGKRPLLFRVVAIQMRLAQVGMGPPPIKAPAS
jgi:hypothetical protein